jgi:hypothetical protein
VLNFEIMSSFSKILSGLLTGPNVLIGATGSVLLYMYLAEKQTLKMEKPILHQSLCNLSSKNPEERQKAISDLVDELQFKRGPQKTKEETEETRDIIFDYGALKALHKTIANAGANEEASVHDALKAILYILAGGIEKRQQFIRIGGLQTVANILLPNVDVQYTITSNIRELAGMVLRKATRFDVERKELSDDVPAGSEGGGIIVKQLTQKQFQEIRTILTQKSVNQNLKSAISIISHCSQTKAGVTKLVEHDVGQNLIQWLLSNEEDTSRKQLRHNVVIALGNISNYGTI